MKENNKDNRLLLEKIGELYFQANNITLICHNSDRIVKAKWFLFDLGIILLNPISIILNTTVIILFMLIPKTHGTILAFIGMLGLLLFLEYMFIVPVYNRKTKIQEIKYYYRLIAKKLIDILQPYLHKLLCNKDGTVKDIASTTANIVSECLGALSNSSYGITPDIIKHIILYLTNQGLKTFCSIVPPKIEEVVVSTQLLNLQEQMKNIEIEINRNN